MDILRWTRKTENSRFSNIKDLSRMGEVFYFKSYLCFKCLY